MFFSSKCSLKWAQWWKPVHFVQSNMVEKQESNESSCLHHVNHDGNVKDINPTKLSPGFTDKGSHKKNAILLQHIKHKWHFGEAHLQVTAYGTGHKPVYKRRDMKQEPPIRFIALIRLFRPTNSICFHKSCYRWSFKQSRNLKRCPLQLYDWSASSPRLLVCLRVISDINKHHNYRIVSLALFLDCVLRLSHHQLEFIPLICSTNVALCTSTKPRC